MSKETLKLNAEDLKKKLNLKDGEKGDKGDKGDSIKGDKGDKGDRGPRGFKGEDGRDAIGTKGDKGDSIKGDRGEKGKAGKDVDSKRMTKLEEFTRITATSLKEMPDFRKLGMGLRGDIDENRRLIALENTWDRDAGTTTLSPHIANDNVSIGTGSLTSNDITLNATTWQIVDRLNIDDTNYNMFLGTDVFANDNGINNIGIGFQTGYYNDTTGNVSYGDSNVFIGYQAGRGDIAGSTGYRNVAIGNTALRVIKDGIDNVAIGASTLYHNVSGSRNFAMGAYSLYDLDDGNDNIAIGFNSGSALYNVINGANNVALGDSALHDTTGQYNVAMGTNAGYYLENGEFNTFVGYGAGQANDGNAYYNVCIGSYAGKGVLTNKYDYCTIIGYKAGEKLTTGDKNIFIGHMAGTRQTDNDHLLIIDCEDRTSAAGETTGALLYGIMHATPASQSLRINGEILGSDGAKIGDGGTTHYVQTTNEGVQTFHGNARYWQGIWLDTSNFKEPTSDKATLVNRGIGTAYRFTDNQDAEHIHVQVSIPGFWDVSEDLEVILLWDSPTTSANCDWEVRYQMRAADEAMDSTTFDNTVSDIVTSSGTAKGLVHSTINIPTADFAAGDKVLRFAIYRDGNDASDTLGDFAYLHGIRLRGVRYKTGGAM